MKTMNTTTENRVWTIKYSFNNNDLEFNVESIKSFDAPITLAKSYDSNFDYPFAIDVEDTSYWYAEQKERDEDFNKLKDLLS
jgi:hypothetical protein